MLARLLTCTSQWCHNKDNLVTPAAGDTEGAGRRVNRTFTILSHQNHWTNRLQRSYENSKQDTTLRTYDPFSWDKKKIQDWQAPPRGQTFTFLSSFPPPISGWWSSVPTPLCAKKFAPRQKNLMRTCIWGGTGKLFISTGRPARETSISLLKERACLWRSNQ